MRNGHKGLYCSSYFLLLLTALTFIWNASFVIYCQAEEGEGIGWHGPYPYKPPVNGFNKKYDSAKIIKRYDKTNADEIKGLVPEYMIEWLKDKEKWGVFYMNEMEYIKYEPPAGYTAATKKYAGTCKTAPDGQLLNWVAGLPFPKPTTGLEVIWNFQKKYTCDDYEHPYVGVVTDKNQEVKHYNKGAWRRMFLTGRTMIDPKPNFMPNDNGYELLDSFGYNDPYDMRGVIPFYIRYIEQTKPDDMWMYIPTMRRVRRMSTAQRMDSIGGGQVICWDDFQNFSGRVYQFNWKLIERREALLPSMAKGKPEWVEGEWISAVDDRYRRVKAYIIECTPKDPNYIYSKKIFWVDPETWHITYGLYYDQSDKLWIIFNNNVAYDNNGCYYPCAMTTIDMQRKQSCTSNVFGSSGNNGFTPDMWSWNYLKKIYPAR